MSERRLRYVSRSHTWWPWDFPGYRFSRIRCQLLAVHDTYCRGRTDHLVTWSGPCWCPFPRPLSWRIMRNWDCPLCGQQYRLTRPKPVRWWRNWSAPEGHWVKRWIG